jgi:hypothetical protein
MVANPHSRAVTERKRNSLDATKRRNGGAMAEANARESMKSWTRLGGSRRRTGHAVCCISNVLENAEETANLAIHK